MSNPVCQSNDCIVVGAGHAGLAAARSLNERGLSTMVLEQADTAGAEWTRRPAHMRLFTPRSLSALKGVELDGDPDDYPLFSEMPAYLERYRRSMSIEVSFGTRVAALSRDGESFAVETADGRTLRSQAVVLANGSNQSPVVPEALAQGLGADVEQITARDYEGPQPLQGRRIAVIGDGASGRQIALELAGSRCDVLLSGDGTRAVAPERVAGRSIFFWLKRLGIVTADRDSPVARLLRARNPIPQGALRTNNLERHGVRLSPRCVSTEPGAVVFSDGAVEKVDAVVWCLGYCEDASWNRLAPKDDPVWFTRGRGRTPVPGLFVVGRQWLRCRASELILGADGDADAVSAMVAEHLDHKGESRVPQPTESPAVARIAP